LFPYAQTQLTMLRNSKPTDRLENGGFEAGDLAGWEVETGTIEARTAAARSGSHGAAIIASGPATLLQSVSVSPLERYRLSGWFKMTSPPPATAVPLEATVAFFDGSQQIFSPPVRMLANTLDPAAGWTQLQTTVSVPAHADSARIRLKHSYQGTTQWDDVRFERLLPGPAITAGAVSDQFTGPHIDPAQWTRMPGQGGEFAPLLRDGWLAWSDNTHAISTLASFNDLLQRKGEERYRLRFHIKVDAADSKNTGRSAGLSIGNFRQPTTRLLWYLYFSSPSRPKPMLSAFDDQTGRRVFANSWNMPHLESRGTDLWCSMYFDEKEVAVYIAEGAYRDTPDTLVCRYQHNLANLAANGSAYLTLYKGSYQLDEISLTSGPHSNP
ncbi:MAG: hypothetical protein MK364_21185, partial [Pirellulales bacterium]|nr:hypothetical protein [Pirellulales bacterium]